MSNESRAQIRHALPFFDTFQMYLYFKLTCEFLCIYHVQYILKYVYIMEQLHLTNALPPSYHFCEENSK